MHIICCSTNVDLVAYKGYATDHRAANDSNDVIYDEQFDHVIDVSNHVHIRSFAILILLS